MYGDDIRYAKQRLEGTIVRVGAEPVVVRQVFFPGEDGKVMMRPVDEDGGEIEDDVEDAEVFYVPQDGLMRARVVYLRDDNEATVLIDDLNLEPVPLGYINYDGSAYYVARKPMRNDWRQGLRTANMAFIGNEGFYQIPTKELRETVLEMYPTVEKVKEMFKANIVKARAFSRDFALQRQPDGDDLISYKGKLVGKMNMLPIRNEQYKYLTEYLQEVLDAQRA